MSAAVLSSLAASPPLLVQSFRTSCSPVAFGESEAISELRQLRTKFLRSIPNMSSLRHLYYAEYLGFDVEAFNALSHVSATLETFVGQIDNSRQDALAEILTPGQLSIPDLSFPRLTELCIINSYSPTAVEPLYHLAINCAADVQVLGLGCQDSSLIPILFALEISWSLLTDLEVERTFIRSIPATQCLL